MKAWHRLTGREAIVVEPILKVIMVLTTFFMGAFGTFIVLFEHTGNHGWSYEHMQERVAEVFDDEGVSVASVECAPRIHEYSAAPHTYRYECVVHESDGPVFVSQVSVGNHLSGSKNQYRHDYEITTPDGIRSFQTYS